MPGPDAEPLHLLGAHERVVGPDLGAVEAEALDERDGARVGQLLDVLAVGQAEHEHGHALERAELPLQLLDGMAHLAVVDAAGKRGDLAAPVRG